MKEMREMGNFEAVVDLLWVMVVVSEDFVRIF
jgi:hypothetical protein